MHDGPSTTAPAWGRRTRKRTAGKTEKQLAASAQLHCGRAQAEFYFQGGFFSPCGTMEHKRTSERDTMCRTFSRPNRTSSKKCNISVLMRHFPSLSPRTLALWSLGWAEIRTAAHPKQEARDERSIRYSGLDQNLQNIPQEAGCDVRTPRRASAAPAPSCPLPESLAKRRGTEEVFIILIHSPAGWSITISQSIKLALCDAFNQTVRHPSPAVSQRE